MKNIVIADETAFKNLKPTLQEYIEETVDEIIFDPIDKVEFLDSNRYYSYYSDHQNRLILERIFDKNIKIGSMQNPVLTIH